MRSLHIVFASIAVGLTILLLLVSVVVPGETNAIQSRSIGYALNLGHGATRDSQVHQAAVRFAQNIARLTNGRVEVNVHPRNALGSDHALVEMARKGDLDFVISPSSVLSIASPSLHFPELPFYFSSSSELDHLLDGAVGTELTTDLREVGLHGLGFWYGGSKHILARKPVTSLADFDGLRIQISPSRLVREQMAHLGAKPLILKKSDTHAALLLDKISGVEGSLTDLLRVQISSQEQGIKPLDYLSLTEHGYQSLVLTASAGLIRKLPESIKLAIFESARDATQWQRQKTLRQSSDLIKQIESQGTKVVSLSGQERNQIAHRLKTMIERYEPEIGANILVKADQYFFDEYGPQADGVDHFVIGINANFSSASTNGLALKQGLLIAVDEINQAGGLFGKPLYILAKNHKQSASLRAHNLNSLQNRDDMLAIFEGGTSNQPITLKPE
ncbi:MAG: TRAP transporter substrate-binding protein DctP, partial [Pontibacterium sp.]